MEENKPVLKGDKNLNIEPFGTTYKSRTYKKRTCKDIYITIAYREDDPKKIDFVRIQATSKDNNCAVSFLEAFSDMLTFAIRRIRNKHEAEAIVKNLRFHKCLNCPPNKDHIQSCSDAVGQVLEQVLKPYEKEEEKG